MTVTVVTSTIGRPQLAKCIESVKAQTHPCKHYVVVNGPEFHGKARKILWNYPYVVNAFFLPESSGGWGAGPDCNGVFAAIPHLTNSDWIFYLNDDDFFDPNHVESIMALIKEHNLKWAYSLRKFVDIDDTVICEDNWNSLGHHTKPNAGPQFVDNSCFAVSRPLAAQLGMAWSAIPMIGDRCFFAALVDSGAKCGTTGLYTTNYRIGTGTAVGDADGYRACDEMVRKESPGEFPWAKPQVFGVGV